MLKGKLPGADGPPESALEREHLEDLEYAGELMVVQFFKLIRTALPRKK